MIPPIAIAERERPQNHRRAAGGACYESFTLKGLFVRDVVATFARVMTETFTDLSRAAGAAVRALRGNHRPLQFSARNLLFLTPTSDFRTLPTAN
jgi:hypothetical protein